MLGAGPVAGVLLLLLISSLLSFPFPVQVSRCCSLFALCLLLVDK